MTLFVADRFVSKNTRRNRRHRYRVAYSGSVVVIAAGSYWFVERVFFSSERP